MKKEPKMVALILAAGCSSRMESFKPLLPLGRSTVLEEALRSFRETEIHDVRVVVGHMSEKIIPVLEDLGVKWVLNPHYHLECSRRF